MKKREREEGLRSFPCCVCPRSRKQKRAFITKHRRYTIEQYVRLKKRLPTHLYSVNLDDNSDDSDLKHKQDDTPFGFHVEASIGANDVAITTTVASYTVDKEAVKKAGGHANKEDPSKALLTPR